MPQPRSLAGHVLSATISVSGACPGLLRHAAAHQSKQQPSCPPCRVCTVAPWPRWQAQPVQRVRHPLDSRQRAPPASECLSDPAMGQRLAAVGVSVEQPGAPIYLQRHSPLRGPTCSKASSAPPQHLQHIWQQRATEQAAHLPTSQAALPPPKLPPEQARFTSVPHYNLDPCMPGPYSPTLQPATEQAAHLPVAYKPPCTAVHTHLHPTVSTPHVQAITGSSLSGSQPTHAFLYCRPTQAQLPQQPQQQPQWRSLCIAMWQVWGQQSVCRCPWRMLWRSSPGLMMATPPSQTGRHRHRRRRGRAR